MFNGTLIDDLIATVENAETSFRLDPEQESKLAYWYTVAQSEIAMNQRVRYPLENRSALIVRTRRHS